MKNLPDKMIHPQTCRCRECRDAECEAITEAIIKAMTEEMAEVIADDGGLK